MRDKDGSIKVDVSPDSSLIDAMGAAAHTILRINTARSSSREPKIRVKSICIEYEVAELSDEQAKWLRAASGFDVSGNPPFQSPSEVRQFFTKESLGAIYKSGLESYSEDDLSQMAEAVILSRRNCDF